MAAPTYKTDSGRLFHAGQILVCAVGLPARGKTHVIRSLERYCLWLGVEAKIFSLGDYRRQLLGASRSLPGDYFTSTAGERSEATEKLRGEILEGLLQKVINFFKVENGQIALYDANNATVQSRQALRDRFFPLGVQILFIENVCDDPAIVDANIRAVKLNSPDYKGWPPEKAVADYWTRIRDHERTYETIENPSFPYVKIINVGTRMIFNNIRGYLLSRIAFYLMNVHVNFRSIFFARSGQARIEHSYKADSGLSDEGRVYAEQLKDFIMSRRAKTGASTALEEDDRRLTVWTSARRRCIETTSPFGDAGFRVKTLSQLSEINPGTIDGLTPDEIQEKYPELWDIAQRDPWAFRYPRAESYHDLSVRLEPVIFELERDKSDLLIIGHASVLRCLFAYLKGLPPRHIPEVDIRRGDVIEIVPTAYGVRSHTHAFYKVEEKRTKESWAYGSPAPSSMMDKLSLASLGEADEGTRSLLDAGAASSSKTLRPKSPLRPLHQAIDTDERT